MGEIAEMFLDGTLDEETGELIDGDSPGYPRSASRDARERRAVPQPKPKRHACPTCGKRFKTAGSRQQHERDAHGAATHRPGRAAKVPANPDAPGLRMQANEALAAGLGALPWPEEGRTRWAGDVLPQLTPAQQYLDPMCILQDALPILQVVLDEREVLNDEPDEIMRDLLKRIAMVVGGKP